MRLEFGLRTLKKAEGREAVIVLANMAGLLEESLGAIAMDSVVLGTGRVVMQSNGKQVESPFRQRLGRAATCLNRAADILVRWTLKVRSRRLRLSSPKSDDNRQLHIGRRVMAGLNRLH